MKRDECFALVNSGRHLIFCGFGKFGKNEIAILKNIKLDNQTNAYIMQKSYKFLVIGYDNCIEYIDLDFSEDYERKNKRISKTNPYKIFLNENIT